jgi:hypothetical protein
MIYLFFAPIISIIIAMICWAYYRVVRSRRNGPLLLLSVLLFPLFLLFVGLSLSDTIFNKYSVTLKSMRLAFLSIWLISYSASLLFFAVKIVIYRKQNRID